MHSNISAIVHLSGEIAAEAKFYPEGIPGQPIPYGAVDFANLTVFVNEPQHATALTDAFAELEKRFLENRCGMPAGRGTTRSRAREALSEYAAWQAEPVTGDSQDAGQYRYAEFCGRFATLLTDLLDPPAGE